MTYHRTPKKLFSLSWISRQFYAFLSKKGLPLLITLVLRRVQLFLNESDILDNLSGFKAVRPFDFKAHGDEGTMGNEIRIMSSVERLIFLKKSYVMSRIVFIYFF